jgi:Fe-S-cluster containining protein
MGNRCTGKCCESFVLTGIGETPDDIRDYLRRRSFDGNAIADMIVPLYKIEPGVQMPNGSIADKPPGGGGWIFTCAHFDKQARSCGIYASRPIMCRDYPYGSTCEHFDCEWDKGRAGLHPSSAVVYHDTPLVHEQNRVLRKVHLKMFREVRMRVVEADVT